MVEMERFLVVVTLKSLRNYKHKGWSPHHKSFQKQILVPSPAIKRVCIEKTWRICAMVLKGQRCDHLTKLLASHPLGCIP